MRRGVLLASSQQVHVDAKIRGRAQKEHVALPQPGYWCPVRHGAEYRTMLTQAGAGIGAWPIAEGRAVRLQFLVDDRK